MDFLKVLFMRSKYFYVFLVFLGVVNGFLNTALLMFINSTINKGTTPFAAQYNWMVFLLLLAVSLIVTRTFQAYVIHLTSDINYNFETTILTRLEQASLPDFEKLGNEKVFTAMGDLRMLANLPEVLMNAINAFVVILCCFSYLFIISVWGALAVLSVMLMLLTFYIVRNKGVEEKLNQLRTLTNDYYRYLNDLLHGFKQFKISTVRKNNIYRRFLEKNLKQGKSLRLSANLRYMNNELTGSYSWYIVLGCIMFALPKLFNLEGEEVSAFLIAILFLMGPVAVLITLIPTYTNVKIALKRLDAFSQTIRAQIREEAGAPVVESQEPFGAFLELRFHDVCYKYANPASQSTFELGPVNLKFGRGEVVFVTGGNGSGKSTFVNLLAGLYRPALGYLALNGERVHEGNYSQYCDLISVIFTDHYLCSENYNDFVLSEENEQLRSCIELMQLEQIVKFDKERNTLQRNLSKGQQKRVAMIYTLLENKEILVLDEWAAEQDPAFRAYFYRTLLPYCKDRGKTIIVITHDDAYFEYADRIIKFDYGKIAFDKKILDASLVGGG